REEPAGGKDVQGGHAQAGAGAAGSSRLLSGAGRVARMAESRSSTVCPSTSASGVSTTRWRRTGSASAFTSSGVTKSRPERKASAREARKSATPARGGPRRAQPRQVGRGEHRPHPVALRALRGEALHVAVEDGALGVGRRVP